jgi:predicted alpha/beta hydrolase family esterase
MVNDEARVCGLESFKLPPSWLPWKVKSFWWDTSVGASVLLKYLSEVRVETPVAGLFLLAAPFWGADDFWKWDEVQLPQDIAAKLASISRIYFYHSRDDEIVPFAHLALYAARLPQATIREVDGRGHQMGNDLTDVAEDIMRY